MFLIVFQKLCPVYPLYAFFFDVCPGIQVLSGHFFDDLQKSYPAETTLAGTGNGNKYSGFPRFNCPDALADAAKDTGFDMLLTANNHCYDTGSYGFLRTQEVIREREMMHLGTMENADDPRYQIVDINGIRFGMVCYTYGEIDGSGQKSVNVLPVKKSLTEQVNVFDYEKTDIFYEEIGGYIAEMKENGAEQIVVFIHWGNEYQREPSEEQRNLAQWLIGQGVDHIIGSHPHVIQPIVRIPHTEYPTQHAVVYSLGNYISNMSIAHGDVGLVVELVLEKVGTTTRLKSLDSHHVWTERATLSRTGKFRLIPADTIPIDLTSYGHFRMKQALELERQ